MSGEFLGIEIDGKMVALEDLENLVTCARCGVQITEENDSLWRVFVEGGKTQSVCLACNKNEEEVFFKESTIDDLVTSSISGADEMLSQLAYIRGELAFALDKEAAKTSLECLESNINGHRALLQHLKDKMFTEATRNG